MAIAAINRTPCRQSGVAMLETLVTLTILLVGLLGLVGLQTRVHQAQFDSYQRTQALLLLSDMVERIRANPYAAACYAISGSGGTPYLGSGFAGPATCSAAAGTTETRQLAIDGMNDWDALLKGAAETTGGVQQGAMIGARGCISFDAATNLYTVAVSWQGINDTSAPTVSCANGVYGRETLRRTVSATVRIPRMLS